MNRLPTLQPVIQPAGWTNWYWEGLKKYAVFTGRARRKEYWYFMLFNRLILFSLVLIPTMLEAPEEIGGGLFVIFLFATFLPMLSVQVRRLHDRGFGGSWILLNFTPYIGGIVLWIMYAIDGEPGLNQYGPNPKEPLAPTAVI